MHRSGPKSWSHYVQGNKYMPVYYKLYLKINNRWKWQMESTQLDVVFAKIKTMPWPCEFKIKKRS